MSQLTVYAYIDDVPCYCVTNANNDIIIQASVNCRQHRPFGRLSVDLQHVLCVYDAFVALIEKDMLDENISINVFVDDYIATDILNNINEVNEFQYAIIQIIDSLNIMAKIQEHGPPDFVKHS